MPEPIAEAFVEINARLDRFEKELRSATRATEQGSRRMERSLSRVERSGAAISKTFRGVGTVLFAAFSAVAIRRTVDASLDLADSLDKASIRLGVNVVELQRYRFAAQQAGISTGEFDNAIQFLNRNLDEARTGTGEAIDAFARISQIQGQNILALSPLEALDQIAEAFSKIEDPAARSALAMDIFGRSGGRLIQLIGEGIGPIEALKEEFDSFGVALSQDQVKALVAAKDQMAALSTVIQYQLAGAISDILPLITSLTEFFAGLAAAAGEVFSSLREPDLTTLEGLEKELANLDQQIAQLRNPRIQPLSEENLELVVRLENEFEELLAIRDRLAKQRVVLGTNNENQLDAEAIKKAQEEIFKLEQDRLKVLGQLDEVRERQLQRDLNEIDLRKGITEELRAQLQIGRQVLADTERAEEARQAVLEAAEEQVKLAAELQKQFDAETARVAGTLERAFNSAFDRILQDGKVTAEELGRAFVESLAETALQQIVASLSAGLANLILPGAGSFGALFGAASGAVIRKPTIVAAGEKGAEAIVPLDRLGELGGSTVVQVINGTPAATRTTEERMSDGRQLVRVLIGEVASDIASRGQVFRAIQGSAVGVRPRGVRR